MLYSITCDKFKQKSIEFNSGLNVVLGGQQADNSIGKSTFLLIIDFAFGGEDYAKSTDIKKNIGDHNINFCFIFSEKEHFFSRNFLDSNKVYICDSNYKKIESISLNQFSNFLDESYNIQLPNLSFRNAVGRYSRIYGKDNCNEKQPLQIVSSESSETAIDALLKLFNMYEPIDNLKVELSTVDKNIKAYTSAKNYNFVNKINKTQFKKNQKELEELDVKLNKISNNIENGLIGVDSEISEKAIILKNQISNANRMRNKVKLKLNLIDNNLDYKFSVTTNDYVQLSSYFENINFKKFSEVEEFHRNMSEIVKNELNIEKNSLQSQLNDWNNIIEEFEKDFSKLVGTKNVSKNSLNQYAELIRQSDKIKKENQYYLNETELRQRKKTLNEGFTEVKDEQLTIIEVEINSKMKEFNNYIYGLNSNPPIIKFKTNKYQFFTPDDTGTGTAYKGVIIFDITILTLTELPILIHDTIMFKHISDLAIEKIFELYNKSSKQVFISFDKQNKYTDYVKKIVEEKSVLKLGKDGNELFGYSWS